MFILFLLILKFWSSFIYTTWCQAIALFSSSVVHTSGLSANDLGWSAAPDGLRLGSTFPTDSVWGSQYLAMTRQNHAKHSSLFLEEWCADGKNSQTCGVHWPLGSYHYPIYSYQSQFSASKCPDGPDGSSPAHQAIAKTSLHLLEAWQLPATNARARSYFTRG